MATKTQEEVIKQVAKLLDLAENQSANVNEAAVASARAQALMDKYKIEREMVDAEKGNELDEPDEDIVEEGVNGTKPLWEGTRFSQWRWNLADGIAKLNSCKCLVSAGGGVAFYTIIGMPSDIALVRYLFAYTSREIDRLAKEALARGHIHGKTGGNEFRIGAVSSVLNKIKQEKNEARKRFVQEHKDKSNAQRALVRVEQNVVKKAHEVDTFIKGKYPKMGKHQIGRTQRDWQAREAGKRAGNRIGIHAGLGSGKSSTKMLPQ